MTRADRVEQIEAILFARQWTKWDLAQRTGLSVRYIEELLTILRRDGRLRVYSWVHQRGEAGDWTPVYTTQDLPDCPRPAPKTPTERSRDHRRRKASAEKSEVAGTPSFRLRQEGGRDADVR